MNKKIILLLSAVLVSVGIISFTIAYNYIYKSNINIKDNKYLYIQTGSTFEIVLKLFKEQNLLKNLSSFDKISKIKDYPNHIKPGRYLLKKGMSNNELINMLKSGNQEPVKFAIYNIRTLDQLISLASKKLEVDSIELMKLMYDDRYLSIKGFTSQTILSMFLPLNYEIYWNTNAKQFVERMFKEYKKFWNEDRLKKAKNIRLNPIEVTILASIIQAEQSQHVDEKPIIAGLYINRLKKGMALQACPTVKYAKGDFAMQRVYSKDSEIDSPFNTYQHPGLPPSPINLPELSSIDAVLNYEPNDYLYMCAKEDFSGYHNFSRSYEQHQVYARKYQRELNKLNIKR